MGAHQQWPTVHAVGAEHSSLVWDRAAPPVIEVNSNETVELEVADASGGQLTAESTARDVAAVDIARVNPITGPVFVRGAMPGDVLAVDILELRPRDWGWTAIMPGFGLLADEYPDPWLRISRVDEERGEVHFGEGVRLPFEPFPGTIGVAPPDPGKRSTLVPHRWGGNMDIKHLRVGATLFLPVAVEGALFSVGDTHAAMGDAEVCGTAVETGMDIVVRLSVRRDMSIMYPHYHLPAAQGGATESSSFHVSTGIHGDLMEATREATRGIIDYMVDHLGRGGEEAYAIASVAVDLRIHEVVDAPNWVVGAFLPERIFA
jgi:acetamidase/formamidase